MEQVESGGSLSIQELPSGGEGRELLPEGTYEAVYTSMKVFWEDTNWGKKKSVRLFFKITRGPVKGKSSSFKRNLFNDKKNPDNWFIASESELASVIRAITHGALTINDSHKDTPVFIEITHTKSKKPDPKTGEYKVWDFVTKVMAKPVDNEQEAAAPVAKAAQGNPGLPPSKPHNMMSADLPKPAAEKPVPAAITPAPVSQAPSSELLTSLTELGDFKL